MQFKELGLSPALLKAIEKLEYQQCTLVQEQLIPAMMNQEDCIVKAQTGSGKTAAFGLGLLQQLVWEKKLPQVLIMAPTRELALQIQEELNALSLYAKVKTVLLLGRQPYKPQMEQLKSKCHIVIGTPGRVKDHIDRGSLLLDEVKTVVLDEADQMLNMGFIDLIRSILKILPTHQSILCSATMPDEIVKIADDFLKSPTRIEIEKQNEAQITQHVYYVEEEKKEEFAVRLLASLRIETAILFASTQEAVEDAYEHFLQLNISCARLHGGMLQNERLKVMDDFRKGKFRYLIATDVAARGIDVEQLAMVINLHLPRNKETYVHRIGRSGRKEAKGMAVLLATHHQRAYVSELLNSMKQTYVEEDSLKVMKEYMSADAYQFLESSPKRRITKAEMSRNDVMKLHLNGGKNKKIRAGDIVGAICEIENLSNQDIGVIEVKENGSTVDILNGKGLEVLKALQNKTVKGKQLRVEKAKQ